jgi:hypothetical protein
MGKEAKRRFINKLKREAIPKKNNQKRINFKPDFQ